MLKEKLNEVKKSVASKFNWTLRDVVIKEPNGNVVFQQENVAAPDKWSNVSVQIAASKYFRGHVGEEDRETSVLDLAHRVCEKFAREGLRLGYFTGGEEDAVRFYTHLMTGVLEQRFSWNSPVWFNVGYPGRKQAISACYINSVEDSMESILDLYKTEGLVFKDGSGSGINISKLRAKNEKLSAGGTSTGPVSFMKGWDRSAGTIKSGGATRRAAKMVLMDADHPDVIEFIWAKVNEERKAKALVELGYSGGVNGDAYETVAFQNANHSVRVTDEFMRAACNGGDFELTGRVDSTVNRTIRANTLLEQIAQACWECGDPGVQFIDSINRWHTTPGAGAINGSNPCSEYLFLDDTSCNLASFNLVNYLDEDGQFQHQLFVEDVAAVTVSMDIGICFADYPTQKLTENTKKYRTLGLGFANLGAMLMQMGIPYASEDGQYIAAAISALMTSTVYATSANLNKLELPEGGGVEEGNMRIILRMHMSEAEKLADNKTACKVARLMSRLAYTTYQNMILSRDILRNAQATVIAPTGTIGLFMGCDTTGIEPELALRKTKTLSGGGHFNIRNSSVDIALKRLGYTESERLHALKEIEERGTLQGSQVVSLEDQRVFITSFKASPEDVCLSYLDHVDMMVAVQPHISGAISKTVNLPGEASVTDVVNTIKYAWENGLKCLAIYRDGCKGAQPLTTNSSAPATLGNSEENVAIRKPAERSRLPDTRTGLNHKFSIGGWEGYVLAGFYDDGELGEVFIRTAKEGTTVSGLLDTIGVLMSIGLQYGVPLDAYVSKLSGTKFDPAGFTLNPDIPFTTSIPDYLVRFLEDKKVVGSKVVKVEPSKEDKDVDMNDHTLCTECQNIAYRAGTCYVCSECGTTTGCG